MNGTVATYGIRARSPLARAWALGLDMREAHPRHCAECGRGLTQRTRAALTMEESLILAIFGNGPQCERCAPLTLARLAPQP